MRNKLSTDQRISRIAAPQHGVITTRQLLACGLTRPGIVRRVRAGRLFQIHRGVYAVGHPNLSAHAGWKAATLAVPRGVLSHRSAAELWELLGPRYGIPQITVPFPASAAKRPNLRIFRSKTLARTRTTSRDNIPVTMPARTLADLARVASAPEVRRARREAERRGLPLGEEHMPSRTESDLEDDFLALCRAHGISEPECQARVGPYRVDFLWRRERLIIEVDGYVYHRGRQTMRDDNDRDLELELRGFQVVRVDDSRIADDPAGLARDVLALVQSARSLSRGQPRAGEPLTR